MRILNHKLTIAFIVGVCLAIYYIAITYNKPPSRTLSYFELALFPLAVLFVSYPLNNYRQSIATAAIAVLACTAVQFASAVFIYRYTVDIKFAMTYFGIIGFASLIVNIIVVSIATFLRRWLYPVYTVGHCQNCGYNLTGNESGICSECGTQINKPSKIPEK